MKSETQAPCICDTPYSCRLVLPQGGFSPPFGTLKVGLSIVETLVCISVISPAENQNYRRAVFAALGSEQRPALIHH